MREIRSYPVGRAMQDKATYEIHDAMLACHPSSEAAAILALRLMIQAGPRFSNQWGIPKVDRYRLEVNLSSGRADVALFHIDGSVSLVEVKAFSANLRDILGGIGQLCYYASVAQQALNLKPDTEVRRILCAPMESQVATSIMDACKMAGVLLRNLPPQSVIAQQMATYRSGFAPLVG